MTLIDQYFTWLKGQFTQSKIDDWTEITTPFLDRNNDHVQVYIKQIGDRVVTTDDGQTFVNLALSGIQKTQKRVELIASIFRGFQVDWTDDSKIEITCSTDEFASKFHDVIQTILAVDGVGILSRENVKSLFADDVADFLRQKKITYHANQEIAGKSGLKVNFPFFIPAHKNSPSAYIQLINNPKINLKPYLFEWIDTADSRESANGITILNDVQIKPTRKVLNAFQEYDISTLLWSNRDELSDLLVG